MFFWFTALGFIYGVLTVVVLLSNTRRKAAVRLTYTSVTDEGDNVVAYLATNLLPLITLDVRSWRDLTAVAIYVVVLAVTFLRSNLGAINPTLYLLRYRTLACIRSDRKGTLSRAFVVVDHNRTVPPSGTLIVHSYGKYHFASRKLHDADS